MGSKGGGEVTPPSRFWLFLYRWSRVTSQSGRFHGAGAANGSSLVGHPATSLVEYWYHATPSVTGITGTSSSITASTCLMRSCCLAESVVAPNWSNRVSTLE